MFTGVIKRVVRTCVRIRAVRRQRGGGDRHAATRGRCSVLAARVALCSTGDFNTQPCVSGRGERAEPRQVQQHGEPGRVLPLQVSPGRAGEHQCHF